MELGLNGRAAVITGGASGLGRETARYLVRDGVRLLIADRNRGAIEETVKELRTPERFEHILQHRISKSGPVLLRQYG